MLFCWPAGHSLSQPQQRHSSSGGHGTSGGHRVSDAELARVKAMMENIEDEATRAVFHEQLQRWAGRQELSVAGTSATAAGEAPAMYADTAAALAASAAAASGNRPSAGEPRANGNLQQTAPHAASAAAVAAGRAAGARPVPPESAPTATVSINEAARKAAAKRTAEAAAKARSARAPAGPRTAADDAAWPESPSRSPPGEPAVQPHHQAHSPAQQQPPSDGSSAQCSLAASPTRQGAANLGVASRPASAAVRSGGSNIAPLQLPGSQPGSSLVSPAGPAMLSGFGGSPVTSVQLGDGAFYLPEGINKAPVHAHIRKLEAWKPGSLLY